MRSWLGRLGLAITCAGLIASACSTDDDSSTAGSRAAVTTGAGTTAGAVGGAAGGTAPATTGDATRAGTPTTTATVDDVGDVPAALRTALENGGDFSNFLSALKLVGLDSVSGSGQFTLFVPTDEAFRALDGSVLAKVLADRDKARLLLRNHVVDRKISSQELGTMSSVTVDSGAALVVAHSGGSLTVGGATVTKPDVAAGAGTIDVIDKVLVPAELVTS
jgi:uncharacterized surface protein with fasciclin (FAS1) repeats